MTDFLDEVASQAVVNQPPVTMKREETEKESENSQEKTVNEAVEEESFSADASFLVPALIEVINSFWSYIWGKEEGGKLTDTEKEGFESLFERGANHFGISRNIQGGKGFFIEFILRVIGATCKRFGNDNARKHFVDNFCTIEGEFEEVKQTGEKEDAISTTTTRNFEPEYPQ